MEEEEWRDSVSGVICQYQVSNRGRIRRTVRGGGHKLLKGTVNSHGYVMHHWRSKEGTHFRSIHSLVAEAFLGPRPEGMFVDHIDRNRTNNDIANLRYVTRTENNRNSSRYIDNIPELEGLDVRERNRVLMWIAARRRGRTTGVRRTKLNLMYEPMFSKYIDGDHSE